MTLEAERVAFTVIESVRPLLEQIRRHDRSLHDQARRAASSVVLNISEAQYSDAGNSRARYHTAAGSAHELSAALRLAVAWGYITARAVEPTEARIDQTRRLLWGLTRVVAKDRSEGGSGRSRRTRR